MDFLNELKDCPLCKQKVKYGDMIWKDGLCLCPKCYIEYRANLEREYLKGFNDAKIIYKD